MTSLTPAQQACKARALADARAVLRRVSAQQAQAYADGGAMAVADAAWRPGGPSREEIAARYEAKVQARLAAQEPPRSRAQAAEGSGSRGSATRGPGHPDARQVTAEGEGRALHGLNNAHSDVPRPGGARASAVAESQGAGPEAGTGPGRTTQEKDAA